MSQVTIPQFVTMQITINLVNIISTWLHMMLISN
jgi:hypothetical protein